jgi:hypothetical protein
MKKFIDFLVKWEIPEVLLYIFIIILVFSIAIHFGW